MKHARSARDLALLRPGPTVPRAPSPPVARLARWVATAAGAQHWRWCVREEVFAARLRVLSLGIAASVLFVPATPRRPLPVPLAATAIRQTLSLPCRALLPRSASLGQASRPRSCAPSARLGSLAPQMSPRKPARVQHACCARQTIIALDRRCLRPAPARWGTRAHRVPPALCSALFRWML